MDHENRNDDEICKEKSGISDSKQSQTSATSMIELINVIADRVEPVINILTTVFESNLKYRQSDTRFRIHMAWIAVAVVAIIVGVSTFLTFRDKMDSANYGFLLGLIVGYALTFIRDTINPKKGE